MPLTEGHEADQHTAAGPAKRPLSREAIIDVALELVRREGYESLSMRRIAGTLGVTNMALYRHFTNRAELESEMVDVVLHQAQALDRGETPSDARLVRAVGNLYGVLLDNPAVVDLIARRGETDERIAQRLTSMQALAVSAGIPPARSRAAGIALGALAFGFALYELRLRMSTSNDAAPDTPAEFVESARADFDVALTALWAGLRTPNTMEPDHHDDEPAPTDADDDPTLRDRLRLAASLHDEGLIDDDDFKAKKAQLLDDL